MNFTAFASPFVMELHFAISPSLTLQPEKPAHQWFVSTGLSGTICALYAWAGVRHDSIYPGTTLGQRQRIRTGTGYGVVTGWPVTGHIIPGQWRDAPLCHAQRPVDPRTVQPG